MCDSFWDCPYGFDEINCAITNHTGLYRCHNTSITILPGSVCDNILDCPSGDDEKACDLSREPCPSNCSCLLHAIQCTNINSTISSTVNRKSWPYVYLLIYKRFFLNYGIFANFLSSFPNIRHMHIVKCDLNKYEIKEAHFPYLVTFDFSRNLLKIIKSNSISDFKHLKHVLLSYNYIKLIKCQAFGGSYKLATLDLEGNALFDVI